MRDKEYIARLRNELEIKKKLEIEDPLAKWSEKEKDLLKQSFNPEHQEMYEESRMLRKMKEIHERDVEKETKSVREIEAKMRFPILNNPDSNFAKRVEVVARTEGLNILAAAKLVSIRYQEGEYQD